MVKFYNNAIFRQYCVVITVNLCLIATGAALIWPSPVLVKLSNSTETVLSSPLTEVQGSWIVSIPNLLGIMASLCVPFLGDMLGRKYGLTLACLLRILAGILFTCATEVWMLLLGRAILGLFSNAVFILVPMYASEMASGLAPTIDAGQSHKNVRGSLGSILQIECSFGILIMLSIGPFMSYISLNITLLCMLIITTLPLFFLPESPYFLHSKGKKEEALKVLKYLRSSESIALDELSQYEADSVKNENVNTIDLLKDKLFLKSAILVIILALGSQFNGFKAVYFYMQTILESTQTTVKPEIASIVIGVIQLLASFGTTFMADKFGRKSILIVTCIGLALGMLGLGIFFKQKESGQVVGFMNYLPLLSFMIAVYCFSAGYGSLYLVVASELFTDKSRSLGMSISQITMTVSLFITTKYFATLTSAVGPAYIYWGFCIICIIMSLFIKFFIPETKGKSFAEIQDLLKNKKDNNRTG